MLRQSPSLTAVEGQGLARAVIKTLERDRNEGNFQMFGN